MRSFFEKYKQLILYLIFGVITTVASLVAWWITMELGVLVLHDGQGEPTELLDVLGSTTQWIVGVLVAFFTNRKWVFTEAENGARAGWIQLGKFAGARVGTYFLEVAVNLGVIALFDLCGYRAFTLPWIGFAVTSRIWAKAVSSVFVVMVNYVISKWFVFKKKK